MVYDNMTYKQVETAFYEAMRTIKKKTAEWSKEKEGNALIDPARTCDNFEIVPHHEILDPSNVNKRNRGRSLAEHHRKVTGRSARMQGEEKHLSKCACIIGTLPRDYLRIDYSISDAEYAAAVKHIENDEKTESPEYESAMSKIIDYRFTEEEKAKIKVFFTVFFEAWKKISGIRDEDILYCICHMDETFPHIHIVAFPSTEREDGSITYSVAKFSNFGYDYRSELHPRMIEEMGKRGIDASGLLNGATARGKKFKPGDFNHLQREEAVKIASQNLILSQMKEKIKNELVIIEGERIAEEKRLEKVRILRTDTALSERDHKKHMLELKRVRDVSSQPHLGQYEYENLLNSVALSKDLKRREKELAERARNFNAVVTEEASRMLPEECWAESLSALSQDIVKREDAAEKRENHFQKIVEQEVEIRLRDHIKEIFVIIIEEIFRPDGFLIRNMKRCLPREMFEGLERFIRGTISNLEKGLIESLEGPAEVKEGYDITYKDQDLGTDIEDYNENVELEKD
ncbi:MAG: hypothetical protein K0R05_3837 [Anaerocolumna sp.]|nr:hypothetical protein [Anaerocolumna sp.]